MANNEDYLTRYKRFFEDFAATVNPDDQLPVKVAVNSVTEGELTGEILDWTVQYLNQKGCPPSLVAPLCRIVLSEVRAACSKQPTAFGYRPDEEVFVALRLMQTVLARVNAVCLRYSAPGSACDTSSLPAPPVCPPRHAPSAAVKNSRRAMEDRHVVIDDLNVFFDIKNTEPTAFYAVYDGHAGSAAAAYAAAHLHQYFVESEDYVKDPRYALYTAFKKTDLEFVRKGQNENLSSGTTAAVIVIRGNILYAAWVGDSQALLVKRGELLQLVHPHKPSRDDERTRIEKEGGSVMYWGTWRVNGQLAVSRAIGDSAYKPYVTSTPDISVLTLDGDEDFIILACDGLWDFVSEDAAALEVYRQIQISPDDPEAVTQRLVQLSKDQCSTDNISVIVVFLKEPREIAASARWHLDNCPDMDAGLDNSNNAQANAFLVNSNPEAAYIKDNLLLDGFKQQNGVSEGGVDASQPFAAVGPDLERASNGKRRAHDLDDDMEEDELDLGPETDVDALDEFGESFQHRQNNNLRPEVEGEIDHEIQRRQTSEFEPARTPREETPTPPADHVLDIGTVLVENVADSGEDSEDEWNYYKGDQKNAQDINSEELSYPIEGDNDLVDRADIDGETSDMNSSPLNPEAAPFIPVSPTTGAATSPVPPASLPSHVLDDVIVAESPRKPVPMDDIVVPNALDFKNEADTKPSELGSDMEYLNGHSEISGMSSQENLKENLQGKEKADNGSEFGDELSADSNQIESQILLDQQVPEEVDFQRVQKDITDFCDIQVCYTNPSQAFDAAIDEELFERLKNKERDPMSMSFYQEKDEDTCEIGISSNPFDLNAVQLLPNDDEDEEISNEVKSNEIFGKENMNFTNNFINNDFTTDVTTSEINAAIKDLDNAVHHEADLILNHSDDIPSEELSIPGIVMDKAQSPIDNHSNLSDNVSQLTEPSDADLQMERDIVSPHKELEAVSPVEAAISQDSALSREMSSPPASPFDNDADLCQISHSPVPIGQISSNVNVDNVIVEYENIPERTEFIEDKTIQFNKLRETYGSEPMIQIENMETDNVKFGNNLEEKPEHLFDRKDAKESDLSIHFDIKTDVDMFGNIDNLSHKQTDLTQAEPNKFRPTEEDFDCIKETEFIPEKSEHTEDIFAIRPSHLQEEIKETNITFDILRLQDGQLSDDQLGEVLLNSNTEKQYGGFEEVPVDNIGNIHEEPLLADIPQRTDNFDTFKLAGDINEPVEFNKYVAQEICQPVLREIPDQMVDVSNSNEFNNIQNRFVEDMDGNEVKFGEGFDPVAHNKGKQPGDPGYICICPPCPPQSRFSDSNTENEFGVFSQPIPNDPANSSSSPNYQHQENIPLEPKDQFGFTDYDTRTDIPPSMPAMEISKITLTSETQQSKEIIEALKKLNIYENENVKEFSVQETEILAVSDPTTDTLKISKSESLRHSPESLENTLSKIENVDEIVKPVQTESDNLVNIAAATAVGAVVAATTAAVISSLDKKTPAKPKTTTAKKPTSTTTRTPGSATKPPTSPTKSATPKTTTTPKTAVSATKKAAPSPITKAPLSSPKPSPKVPPVSAKPITKTSSTTVTAAKTKITPVLASKPPEKKPLTNGDVKAPLRKSSAPATSVTARAPITKPPAPKTTLSTTTAPKPPVLKSAPSAPAAKLLPASRSLPATKLNNIAASKPAASRPAVSSLKAATSRPTSGTNTTKAPVRAAAPVADKLAKETTNRQISTAKPAPARPASAKVTETKSTTTLKTATKTSTTMKTTTTTTASKKTTSAAVPSKPKPITRMSASKVAPIKSPKSLQNGPTTITVKDGENRQIGQGEITVNGTASITENEVYMKDSSPQQVENSLLPVLDVAAD